MANSNPSKTDTISTRETRGTPALGNETQAEKRPPVVTIMRPRSAVFSFLSDFSNFRHFVPGIHNVTMSSPKVHHWTAEKTNHSREEWNTEIVEEQFERSISWKLLDENFFDQTGTFELSDAPGGKGTVVSLALTYTHWIGEIWGATAKVVGKDPSTQAAVQLRRLKAYLETGEVPSIEGQPSGRQPMTH